MSLKLGKKVLFVCWLVASQRHGWLSTHIIIIIAFHQHVAFT
jgi:hypothetical protein